MPTPFSSDTGKAPPPRYTPAAGNIGAKAAERALKPGGRGQSAQPQPASRQRSAQPSLGHPNFGQQDQGEDQNQPKDNRHLDLVGNWHNMQGLNRAIPWTVWADLTGAYRDLAKEGQPPFDIWEDT